MIDMSETKGRDRDSDRDRRRSRSRDRNRIADRENYGDRDIDDRKDRKRNRSRSRSDEYYYGSSSDRRQYRGRSRWDRSTRAKDDSQVRLHPSNQTKVVSDWTCPSCSYLNYSRRDVCHQCSTARVEDSNGLTNHTADFPDNLVFTPNPSTFIAARGLHISLTEEEISEIFRQFALVKNVTLLKHGVTQLSRGLAFIEFYTLEHAIHACKTANSVGLKIYGISINMHYANIKFMREQLKLAYQAAFSQTFVGQQYEASNRLSSTSTENVQQVSLAPNLKPEWPPIFELAGSAYLFQSQSGFFYEPLSEFYFCPKTRLYYSCKDKSYYRHDSSISPPDCPFERFDPPKSAATEVEHSACSSLVPSSAAPAASEVESLLRKPVIISLSSGSVGKAKPKGVVAPSRKIMEENIAKWGAISKDEPEPESSNEDPTFIEKCNASVAATSDDAAILLSRNSATTTAIGAQVKQVVNTGTDAPTVCLVCRRQFTSHDMLGRHERESKLHAENVAKQQIAAAVGTVKSTETVVINNSALVHATESVGVLAGIQSHLASGPYRDRASERRMTHGQSAVLPLPPADFAHSRKYHGRPVMIPSAPFPSQQTKSLLSDESNPGNIMLRAMGWTPGKGIGRGERGIADPIQACQQSSSSHAGLGSDNTIPKIIYREGDEQYKQSLFAASRARFEKLDKNIN